MGELTHSHLVEHESAFGVVQKSEILLGLFNLHYIHEACRVEHVAADLSVHFDQALHNDHFHLTVGQSILQALPQHDNQGKALTQFVRTSVWLGSPSTPELIQHPLLGRIHALQVLDDAARHDFSANDQGPEVLCDSALEPKWLQ